MYCTRPNCAYYHPNRVPGFQHKQLVLNQSGQGSNHVSERSFAIEGSMTEHIPVPNASANNTQNNSTHIVLDSQEDVDML